MAVVRCPTHNIPYNDENPRGCPACARAKDGPGESDVMRELARVSRVARGLEEPPAPKGAPVVEIFQALRETAPPPRPEASWLDKIRDRVRARPFLYLGASAIPLLAFVLLLVGGPRYVEAPDPPAPIGAPRPLPERLIRGPIEDVFALLGTESPRAVPDAPRLARYEYGTGLTIDALNGTVYAITFSLPSRSWQGITIGAPEQTVRGALALLGIARELTAHPAPPPQTVSGYRVYASADQRPARTLHVDVRPPNGCVDVEVELRPQLTGILIKGDRRLAVIGRGGAEPDWVSTEVRIVNRAVASPSGGAALCP